MDGASTGNGDESHLQPVGESFPESRWKPSQLDFRPYSSSSAGTAQKCSNLRVIVGKPLVARLTKDLVETYQICYPAFKYCGSINPKRLLTNPSVGVLNDGLDNANSDLILTVDFVLVNLGSKQRYIVKDILGQGTFGQVAKCWVSETNGYVAVKIIKNQPAYYQQALVEVSILTTLNQKFDPEDKRHIVRILDYFVHQHHLCISFEMLGANLYELIRVNQFRGLSLNIVQVFSKQILNALVIMKEAGIIHCDLKPENILLAPSYSPAEIKIIDFGSACLEDRTVYSYIQSRYYRSPEVLLGYTTAIDMWSFGCIVAELFLGLPLFPGASEFDLIKRMIEILGGQPPDHILRVSKNTSKFFKHVGSIHRLGDDEFSNGRQSAYQILSEEEYEARELKKPVLGKRYFNYVKLEDIITNYPHRKSMTEEEVSKENLTRLALMDFLRGLVEFDPAKRWSPVQAVSHPFVTGEPLSCPYIPPPETPRIGSQLRLQLLCPGAESVISAVCGPAQDLEGICFVFLVHTGYNWDLGHPNTKPCAPERLLHPVCQTVTVNHNPGAGHWLVAGLSPQVSNLNQGPPQNSPHFQMAYSYASSYGSLGSHGSCNGSAGLGSSYGSYGDGNNLHSYYSSIGPSGMSIHAPGGSILGTSPDARWKIPQRPHGNALSMNPTPGTFRPTSLGASPSQFTPPSSQIQVSSGSPGKYGPTSPARGNVHGSPLGKAAAFGQFNRRRSLGFPGNYCVPYQENAPSQHWQAHHPDGCASSHPEGQSRGPVGSPRSAQSASNIPCWRQHRGGNGFSSGIQQNPPVSFPPSSHGTHLTSSDASYDKPDSSSSPPDPGDWDPNYSDEQLLQEDGSDVSALSSGVSTGMRISHASGPASLGSGTGRFNRGCNQAQTSSSCSVGNHSRTNGPVQAYAHIEGSPPSLHDMQAGYSRHVPKLSHHMPHPLSQNSPSRLGQQPVQQRFNHPLQPTFVRGDRVHPKVQPTPTSCTITGPRSPGKGSFTNGTPWGRRAGHPVITVPPSAHGRKDYGRIV